MKLFEGKSPTERNKIIAALVLGALSLFSLWMAFGGSIFSSKPSVTVNVSPTPKPSASPNANREEIKMPSADEMDQVYSSIPVAYSPNHFFAPDAGRNIFAFYEPPAPTPYSPTPVPPPVQTPPPTPIPTPTPEFLLAFVNPQSVYAGSKAFRLEVGGDKFKPESRIYFNGTELPTVFVSPQKLVADIPANLISIEGSRQIIIQTPDGKLYSNQMMLEVQTPPKPQMQYIGMIARKHSNNDTAYFQEQGKKDPTVARLNDVVAGRFRLVSISANETVFEDTSLGFRHKLPLFRPAPGQNASTIPPRRGGISNDGFTQPGIYVPPTYNQNNVPQGDIPGIPSNIPRYVPPQQATPTQQPGQPRPDSKKDNDDDDDDGDGDN
jgi:hypothetical protein